MVISHIEKYNVENFLLVVYYIYNHTYIYVSKTNWKLRSCVSMCASKEGHFLQCTATNEKKCRIIYSFFFFWKKKYEICK